MPSGPPTPIDGRRSPMTPPTIATIEVSTPFHARGLLDFLAVRAVDGVEHVDGPRYTRSLRLPSGPGVVRLTFPSGPDLVAPTCSATVTAECFLTDPADIDAALASCRHLLDADADATQIDAVLRGDAALAGIVATAPGLRVPGAVDGPEILVRALVGQQVSVAAARVALGKLTALADERLAHPVAGITHLFPGPVAIDRIGAESIAGPRRRAAAIHTAAADMAAGRLAIDTNRTATDLTAALVARAGIGPWTAGYVCMRVLRDPDTLLTGDLALRHGAATLGLPDSPAALTDYATRWRPWRSYAGMYLWRAASRPQKARQHR